MIRELATIALTCLTVAACSPTAGGNASSVSSTPPAGSANSTNLSSSQVLTAYGRTFATSNAFNVTTAQAAGIQGFASGPGLPNAALGASSFKTAVVTLSSDKKSLGIQIEGKTYNLKEMAAPQVVTINGKNYTAYGFSANGAIPTSGSRQDAAVILNGQYASLAAFLKNSSQTSPAPHNNDGFAVIATGGETEVGRLPTQVVNYGGSWYLVTSQTYDEGKFTAKVDFNAKNLAWSSTNSQNLPSGSGTATIDGNQFTGKVNFSGAIAGSGDLAGAFYGPNAEEMAGVVSGNVAVNGGASQPVGGGFIGNKN